MPDELIKGEGDPSNEVLTRGADKAERVRVKPAPFGEEAYRSFVACKSFENHSVLVQPGKVITAPLQPGTPMGLTPMSHRDGDVWARFHNGYLTTKDPAVIAWCLEHPTVCRPGEDPRTKAWAALKAAEVATASSEPFNHGVDADKVLFGDGNPADGVITDENANRTAEVAVAAANKRTNDERENAGRVTNPQR
jgi:hypothetical protein